MAQWIRVAGIDDCPPGSAREFLAGDSVVALFNVDGTFYALNGVCPHQGGPLGKGTLCGAVVTCPWHGWQFDVRSGQNQVNPRIVQPGFEVRAQGADLLVRRADD
jgi:nitrite reductase (NADH) small subunit